ncbi:MAG: pilus assembly protein [Alcaligenaceae bacterium]|nr:pilus assembly protein [Alcaligenaceae bacterium]
MGISFDDKSFDASHLQQQSGQSIAEALVLLLALIVMFTAIPWLGRISDIALQQANASRYAAFQLTRHEDGVDESDLKYRFFLSREHQWKDRANSNIIPNEAIHINAERSKKLDETMQPGGSGAHQASLRREWKIEDKGIATIHVNTQPQYTLVDDRTHEAMSPGLSFFDQQILNIQRHTSILTGTAHSFSDLNAHQRSADSNLAWKEAVEASYERGKQVAEIAAPVDSAWNRPDPVFDWLTPWAGQLPGHHLESRKRE